MRIAVIAGSIAAGVRLATEVENLPGVDVFVLSCNAARRTSLLRWTRELLLLAKSFRPGILARLWRYIRSHKLIVFTRSFDDPSSISSLRSLQCDVGLHAANLIYREPTISAFRLGILNAHIGILPQYRGRSVAEWSVLEGNPTGVTVFFIDTGIDTGERIVLREFIPWERSQSVRAFKRMLFDSDARLYRRALQALMSPEFQYAKNDTSKGQRYYVMSKLFTGAVDKILHTPVLAAEPVECALPGSTELVTLLHNQKQSS
jgi:Formyl transferase